MVGESCSRRPVHIWRGKVVCSGPPRNKTTTTSSNEVAKANSAPESTPGQTMGSITLRKAKNCEAPRLRAARIRLMSKPPSVAVTVITTNGMPKTACTSTIPSRLLAMPSLEKKK